MNNTVIQFAEVKRDLKELQQHDLVLRVEEPIHTSRCNSALTESSLFKYKSLFKLAMYLCSCRAAKNMHELFDDWLTLHKQYPAFSISLFDFVNKLKTILRMFCQRHNKNFSFQKTHKILRNFITVRESCTSHRFFILFSNTELLKLLKLKQILNMYGKVPNFSSVFCAYTNTYISDFKTTCWVKADAHFF